ncbi:MAG: phage terminase large subunit [Clostridia bacterium]|nr:phage terminase large subunit [Clostridia bacterium]
MPGIKLQITRKQGEFIKASAGEVLFGGAAGGGKSYGQVIDALLFALKYPGSKQLILRRTFAELDKSIIRTVMSLYPLSIWSFNASSHTGRFANGSIIDFGYCATENDVYQYQSAEYDVIRFDELTHFTEAQYVYLISRVRGANSFPKQIKSSTNPGGVGHTWVKERFVDPSPPNTEFVGDGGITRIFIPSLITDNKPLMKSDPDYRKRLEALPEKDKKALLYGEWNILEGTYFNEFSRERHVVEPFKIPADWRKYRSIDYGLDRLACLWVAVSSTRDVYVYRELCESDLPISAGAKKILAYTQADEKIYSTLAPPDLWSRSQETGRSKAALFYDSGLGLTKTSNNREAGWLSIKELLSTDTNGHARLHIFNTCTELIRCLPALQRDKRKPTDCAIEPHDITHAPDALRGFAIYWTRPNDPPPPRRTRYRPDILEDYMNGTEEERAQIRLIYGEPDIYENF